MPLTLNNARVRELLIFLFFLKVRSRSKTTQGASYVVKTAAIIASNDELYGR